MIKNSLKFILGFFILFIVHLAVAQYKDDHASEGKPTANFKNYTITERLQRDLKSDGCKMIMSEKEKSFLHNATLESCAVAEKAAIAECIEKEHFSETDLKEESNQQKFTNCVVDSLLNHLRKNEP